MINWIMKKLGYVKCIICDKWTQPSIIFGNICSQKCLNKIKKGNNLKGGE